MAEQLAQIESQIAEMKQQLDALSGRMPSNKLSMVVHDLSHSRQIHQP